jgi:hypothetical protein
MFVKSPAVPGFFFSLHVALQLARQAILPFPVYFHLVQFCRT